MPSAWKNSAISFASGAPPEIGTRSRPPSAPSPSRRRAGRRARACTASQRGHRLALLAQPLARRPTPSAQSISLRRAPVASANVDVTAACTFSKTRGTLGRIVGRTCGIAAGHLERIGEERDRVADVRRREVHEAPVVVREREVEEQDVLGGAVIGQLVDDRTIAW